MTTATLFAFNAEVKKAPVTLVINEQKKVLKKGEKFSLNVGDVICFKEGDGRVVIVGKNYRKQLSKRTKSCSHLPGNSGEPAGYSKLLQQRVVSMFEKTKEMSKDGVSRKGLTSETFTEPITLGKDAKYLAIENDAWGPLPITLELLDEKGTVIETMTNEEDILTSFILPRGMLIDGYSIKISNAFGDFLVDSKIY